MYTPPLAEDLGQVARWDAAAEDGVKGIRAGLDVDVVLALPRWACGEDERDGGGGRGVSIAR